VRLLKTINLHPAHYTQPGLIWSNYWNSNLTNTITSQAAAHYVKTYTTVKH